MNNDRRKLIDEARALLDQAKALVEQARDEEQEYFDNMPEAMQGGDKGSAVEETIGTLDEAASEIETISDNLDQAKGS